MGGDGSRFVADYAGPAAMLSFLVAAFVVILSGFSFAEFASRVLITGNVYSYICRIRRIAAMAGWFLICEYLLAVFQVFCQFMCV